MSTAFNVHDAKTNFSKLIDRAAAGETIIVAKAGKPFVKIVAIEPLPVTDPGRFGFMPDLVVPDDFDTMFQDEIIAMFEGGD